MEIPFQFTATLNKLSTSDETIWNRIIQHTIHYNISLTRLPDSDLIILQSLNLDELHNRCICGLNIENLWVLFLPFFSAQPTIMRQLRFFFYRNTVCHLHINILNCFLKFSNLELFQQCSAWISCTSVLIMFTA